MEVAERAIQKGNGSWNTWYHTQENYNTQQWGHTRNEEKRPLCFIILT